MASWTKAWLPRKNGELVEMVLPEVISASRSTDIPAFYADWFFHRLKVGYSAWTNPFNGVRSYVSYQHTRFIVFWSKNPRPLLSHLAELEERGIDCYIQYTLNDYHLEGLEPEVRPLGERIDTFKRLVDRLGSSRVIWRFDPLILTDQITQDALLEKVQRIGEQLRGYTEKLVFSFADIAAYKRVKGNLDRLGVHYREWDDASMRQMAEGLARMNQSWGLRLATCGERIDLSNLGIERNHCVDDELMIRLAYRDKALMDFLKVRIESIPTASLFDTAPALPAGAILLPDGRYAVRGNNRDSGQRLYCGCMRSKDIGEYNTCIHSCAYCYANSSSEAARANYNRFRCKPFGESIG
ncbi:MAG: DUF1848 domain-containing protein [Parabacteroides sp.]